MISLKKGLVSLAAIGAVSGGLVPVTDASEQSSAAPNPTMFTGVVTIDSGANVSTAIIGTVPAGKYFVVQTVSFYRGGVVVSGSAANLLIETNLNGKTGYIGVPEASADGIPYPSASLSATFYIGSGTHINCIAYRTSELSSTETENVTITGYLVDGGPNQ